MVLHAILNFCCCASSKPNNESPVKNKLIDCSTNPTIPDLVPPSTPHRQISEFLSDLTSIYLNHSASMFLQHSWWNFSRISSPIGTENYFLYSAMYFQYHHNFSPLYLQKKCIEININNKSSSSGLHQKHHESQKLND